MGGKWIDALVSTVEKRASEVSALRQKLGSPARGVDGLDHYRTTAGDNSMPWAEAFFS